MSLVQGAFVFSLSLLTCCLDNTCLSLGRPCDACIFFLKEQSTLSRCWCGCQVSIHSMSKLLYLTTVVHCHWGKYLQGPARWPVAHACWAGAPTLNPIASAQNGTCPTVVYLSAFTEPFCLGTWKWTRSSRRGNVLSGRIAVCAKREALLRDQAWESLLQKGS